MEQKDPPWIIPDKPGCTSLGPTLAGLPTTWRGWLVVIACIVIGKALGEVIAAVIKG